MEIVNMDTPTSEFPEIELLASDAEVLNDIGNDPARHITGMPGKGDDAVGVMAVATFAAEELTANFPKTLFQPPAVERRVFSHMSSREHELIAKSRRNRSASFQQCFQMSFRRQLKTQNRLVAVSAMCMATGQQTGFRNPN